MKKEKMITRTIESTKVNFKVFSIENASVKDTATVLNGNISIENAEKILRDKYATDNLFKFIMVESIETKEELYGMPESVFMTYATKLPPRKNYNTQEEE